MIYEYHNIDRHSFKSAWEKGFNRQINDDLYNWIFCSNNKVYVFEDSGEIVGGYCLMPLDLYINNKQNNGYLCNNVFVHLAVGFKYQKERVFEQLAEFCYDKNPGSWIAFPNSNSLSSHLSSGWKKVLNLSVFEFYKNRDLKCSFSSGITIKKVKFDFFSKIASKISLISVNSFSVNKSIDFLKLRYFSNPQYVYDYFIIYCRDKPIGYLILKFFPERERLHIVDFNYSDIDLCNFDNLIYLIYNEYKHLNYKVIDILQSPIFTNKLITSQLFIRSKPLNSMIVKGKSIGEVNFEEAHVVFGDNEVY